MTQVEKGIQKIREAGLRVTEARQAILKTIATFPYPPSIAEIALQTDVDTTTVYRNMDTLVAAGVLEEIHSDTTSRYALAHDHHHDHLLCTSCGVVAHIPCSLALLPHVYHAQFASITHHAVTYYGLCNSCAPTSSSS